MVRRSLWSLWCAAVILALGSVPALPASAAPGPDAWAPGPGASGGDTYDGYVDRPTPNASVSTPSTVQIAGWFVDTSAQGWAGADDVEIFLGPMTDGGSLLAHALFAQPRPDVARALGNGYWAASGWAAAIPTAALVPGSVPLYVYAHSPTKGWWYKVVTITVGPGATARPVAAAQGFDMSYPECTRPEPGPPAFGVVGVNGGRAFTANPCLAREYAWALTATSPVQPHVGFYLNTGNPGPGVSPHWPAAGTIAPRPCDGSWSSACAYDYGWLAARDSLDRARAVAGALATGVPWWLDVEVENSWSDDTATNGADLQGAVDALQAAGVGSVGIYSLSSEWQQIAGPTPPTSPLATLPNWRPGARSQADAPGWCGRTVTGGPVKLVQYPVGAFDGDYPCF